VTAELGIFRGPVFIVGMPRSGTKLMRNLLNRHPAVSLPINESHFIPSLVHTFPANSDFRDAKLLKRFYKFISSTNFFQAALEKEREISLTDLKEHVGNGSMAALIEFILKRTSPRWEDGPFLWGDKTPGYIRHIQLLTDLFRDARFIVMLRDPRDYCLSRSQYLGKKHLCGSKCLA